MQANPFTIDQVRAHWDSVAQEYDRINSSFGWTHTERFETMQSFLPELTAPKIVNVWSRTGSAVEYLRKKYPDATIQNLEASEKMIAIAKKHKPEESFEQTDLHDLPQETESVDVVVSLETLEHVPDPLHFLLEIHRILKVGGRLILSCPPAWAELPLNLYERFFENHGEGPHRFLTVSETLKAMNNCDYEIIEHRGTVLLPVGPPWLKRFFEFLQQKFLRFIGFNRLGIRHFFVCEKKRSRDPVWAKIHEEIIRPGLSMHSGTAVGLSEGTLTLLEPDGKCIPALTGNRPVPQICYDASPEINPSYPAMNEQVFGNSKPKSHLLGEYRRIAIVHSTDEEIRRGSASGGLISAVLIHLLETGKITGAVVLKMDPNHPWRAIPTVARTRGEILSAAQSKYAISPVNTILSELTTEEGPLAYVGLPHQVFAIRKLQNLNHPSVKAIKYIFGPFFGNELYGSATESFLRKFGAKKQDVKRFSYREGEWPGSTYAKLKGGKEVSMPKFHANYLIPFHITESSLLSHDLTNEFTDLSGGDAWAPSYEERGKGFSLLISRTEQGDAIIREMESQGKLECKDIDEEEAIHMQSHGIDFKKRGSLLRMEKRKKRGKRILDYGLPPVKAPFKRRFFEAVLSAIFTTCRQPMSRRIADFTPHWIIGPIFKKTRVAWKKATHNVKRESLDSVE